MTAPEERQVAARPDPGVASRPVLWLGLGLMLLVAGSLAVTAGIFALSDATPGPVVALDRPAVPLRGLDTGEAVPWIAPPVRPALRDAMAAVAARPDPLAPLSEAELDDFRETGQERRP